ncbi:MAG: hypothetical protein M1540_08515 [Candidatus Bathyarchaeota archaeon]|nr:hypothetical protein [Chloroflexota bacterium]MCL5877837.1 hypothetical protein [Candidatus Bathyarchaeota archaeon]
MSLKQVANKKYRGSSKMGLFGFAGFFGAGGTAVLRFRIKRCERFLAYLTFLLQTRTSFTSLLVVVGKSFTQRNGLLFGLKFVFL